MQAKKQQQKGDAMKAKIGKKQAGVIVYGRGLNARHWIDQAKRAGYKVILRNGFCELWK